MVQKDPSLIGKTQAIWISAAANIDTLIKGGIDTTRPETERRVNNKEISWYENLREAGLIRADFNTRFITAGDSRDPEQSGV